MTVLTCLKLWIVLMTRVFVAVLADRDGLMIDYDLNIIVGSVVALSDVIILIGVSDVAIVNLVIDVGTGWNVGPPISRELVTLQLPNDLIYC